MIPRAREIVSVLVSSFTAFRPLPAHQSWAHATPSPNDACALLTKENAALALGETVTGPTSLANLPSAPGTTLSTCEYTGSEGHRVRLSLTRLGPSAVSVYRARCADQRKDGLSGLGDVACWPHDGHEELQSITGATLLSIEIRRSGDPVDAIKDAMRRALARLR